MSASVTVLEHVPSTAGRSRRWQRLVWVLVLALAGAFLGLAVGARLQTRITAEVDLLITPLWGNAFSEPGRGSHLVDLETESHLPSSDAVLRRVAADGGGAPGIEVMRRRLSVHVVPNAEVMVIKYAAENPIQAREMARRIAQATLDVRVERAEAAGAARQEVVTEKLASLSEEEAALGPDPSAALLKVLSQRKVALNAELRDTLAPVSSPGQVIATAVRGDGGAKKVQLVILGGCVLVAALIGVWVGRGPGRRKE